MKKSGNLESVAVRRATLVDNDKARYRVYSTPTEFIAVIAESALMAVKVSGIAKPHKIVRDLPTEGIAIEAKKMAAVNESSDERVLFAMKKPEDDHRVVKDFTPQNEVTLESQFKPLRISDMQPEGEVRARILPPELLSEIIEQHLRATAGTDAAKPSAPAPAAPVAPPAAEPPAAPLVAPPIAMAEAAPPPLSPKDRLLAVADEVLPEAPTAPAPVDEKLSPEEVDKLLNE